MDFVITCFALALISLAIVACLYLVECGTKCYARLVRKATLDALLADLADGEPVRVEVPMTLEGKKAFWSIPDEVYPADRMAQIEVVAFVFVPGQRPVLIDGTGALAFDLAEAQNPQDGYREVAARIEECGAALADWVLEKMPPPGKDYDPPFDFSAPLVDVKE